MITDEGVLDKEDFYILHRMKEFISSDEVSKFAASKQLMIFIERAVSPTFLSGSFFSIFVSATWWR